MIFGVIAGTLFAVFQNFFVYNIYMPAWKWGALLGLGALLGDLVKSFFKRRLSIDPGRPMWIADQVDWILGALLFTQSAAGWTASDYIFLLTAGAVLHVLVNFIGYYLGLRSNPY